MVDIEKFNNTPGNVITYWMSDTLIQLFELCTSIGSISYFTGSQHITLNNKVFLRNFWEVKFNEIGKNKNYCYYSKGGEHRKWFSNIDLVLKTDDRSITFYKTCKYKM